jgi:glycosyltransferase involved in cell wall biosynthesis
MIPRRIAYVLNIFPKISETFVAGEIAELRRRGVEIRILSLLPPRDEPLHEIINRTRLPEITSYDVSAFGSILRQFQPDLLHAHFAKEATQKARELSLETGVPYSFTAHGYDIHRKPPRDFFERAEAARAVITVSQANASYIQRTFGVSKARIHVIPCGIDTAFFCPPAPAGSIPGVPVIVCVARHVEVKNLSVLLAACALLRNRGIQFRCIMAGDGPLRSRLIQERAAFQLDDVVAMPGPVDQCAVLRYWHQATVGVLTSDNEGMPICLMEAASCGVPVVATCVGGIPEMVCEGITGLLRKPGDPKGIADALELVLTDNESRQKMAMLARARAEERFSVIRQVDALMQVWGRVVSPICA